MGCNCAKQMKHYAKSIAFLILFIFLGFALAFYWDLPASGYGLKGIPPVPKGLLQDRLTEECHCAGKGQSSQTNITDVNSRQPTSTANASLEPSFNGNERTVGFNVTRSGTAAVNDPPLLTISHDMGRLGNRMFEYASVLGLGSTTGRRAFVNPYGDAAPDLAKLFRLTHVEDHAVDASWAQVEETKYAYFDPMFKSLPDHNVKITGYVQSWKYFDKIRNTIRNEFTLLPSVRVTADSVLQAIRQKVNTTDPVFVGVHVRQKDDKSTPNTLEAPKSFFTNAMDKMRSLLKGYDVIFLVAGNNREWCLNNFNETDVVVLPPLEPEVHFALLSSCQHGIVSVGSFGWWTAWLTGGQVIFYKKFPAPDTYEFKGFVYEDYYPPHWIPVDD